MTFRVPDEAPVKMKLLYSAEKMRFKHAIQGLEIELQATDLSELDFEEARDKIIRTSELTSLYAV